jgi:hypothetical protein
MNQEIPIGHFIVAAEAGTSRNPAVDGDLRIFWDDG